MNGNVTLTLALVWQLMRAYTLSLLAQLNNDGTPIGKLSVSGSIAVRNDW